MIRKFLPLMFLLLAAFLSAKGDFTYDTNCIEAYRAILSLKMSEAKQLIQKEKQQDPHNGITILLENYVDYFSLMASESKADYERLKDVKSDRLSALEDNDSNSPFYLYSQAEIYLQWSFLKTKFGDYTSSAFDAKKANGLLKDNNEKFPDFLPNQESLALVNVIFGSIPDSFKGISRFLGMSGNAQAGVRKLEDLRTQFPKTKYSFYINEVVYFICTVEINRLHNTGEYDKLIAYIAEMDNNSLLKSYLQGYVASKTAHNDEVITFLEACPKSSDYIKIPSIDYLLGCAKLDRMDKDTPGTLFDYVKEFRGENYVKDAYLKLAYYYLLQNDQDKYSYFIKQVKTRGNSTDEKDQQALWEANDSKPDIDLLKARFYFDGGYYDKALVQLARRDENSFKLLRDKTEYYYRLGRIYDKTGKFNDAVLNYQRAINLGKATKYYFSANSAWSIGLLCEEKRDYKRAGEYYNQALDMKDHQYQTDIDNDAKAGLKRIGQ
jgi:hypothetical protein